MNCYIILIVFPFSNVALKKKKVIFNYNVFNLGGLYILGLTPGKSENVEAQPFCVPYGSGYSENFNIFDIIPYLVIDNLQMPSHSSESLM